MEHSEAYRLKENLEPDPKTKGSLGIENALFKITNLICIVVVVVLIVFALFNILNRGLAGIIESINNPEVQYSLKLSLVASAISTLICIIFAIPTAYGMERYKLPGAKILNVIMEIPLALPPVVSGIALLLLFGQTSLGKFLANHGLKFVFTIKGIILAQFFVNVPYMIRVLRSTIRGINPQLEFVGRTLGCSRLQAFLKITLPLAKNGLLAGVVITWARALGEFGATLMLAGATRMKTETLPISLFLNMSTGNLKLTMGVATILIFSSILSLTIFGLLEGKSSLQLD